MRDGVGADAAAVEAVHWASRNAAYGHVSGWPPAEPDHAGRIALWSAWLSHPDISSTVVAENDHIVGFCTLRPSVEPDLDPTTVAEMPTLYVHPDRWRRGYGRALCRSALERAANRAFGTLILWSLDTNTRAHAFYTSFGFVPEDITKVADWPHQLLVARRYRIGL
jgi:GNAT superfamily N-acetyltransferase